MTSGRHDITVQTCCRSGRYIGTDEDRLTAFRQIGQLSKAHPSSLACIEVAITESIISITQYMAIRVFIIDRSPNTGISLAGLSRPYDC